MKVLLYREANAYSFINKLIEENIVLSEDSFYKVKYDIDFRTNAKVLEIAESLTGDDADYYVVEEIPDGSEFYITSNDWLIESIRIKPVRCFKKIISHTGKVNSLIVSNKELSELQELQAKLTKESDVWKYTIQECSFQELKCGSENPYGVNMAVTLI